MSGSTNVNINGRPALRVDDRGIHAACCAGNTWSAAEGSSSVFINGRPAHRLGDKTRHCGGSGELLEGSPDVVVGGACSSQYQFAPAPKLVLVDLLDGGKPVPEGAQLTCIVGERLHFGVGVDPIGSADDVLWSVSGQVVASYEQSVDRGERRALTATDLRGGQLSFHYSVGSDAAQIEVSAKINGAYQRASCRMRVLTPTGGKFEVPRLDRPAIGVSANLAGTDAVGLVDYQAGDGQGIAFTGIASVPGGVRGQLGMVQLIKSERIVTLDDGAVWKSSSNGRFVVDYAEWISKEHEELKRKGETVDPPRYGYTVAAAPGAARLSLGDGPEQALRAPDEAQPTAAAPTKVSCDDQFKTYLMFRSHKPDAIWVTLALLEWRWAAEAERDPNGGYRLLPQPRLPDGSAATPRASTQLPEWSGNFESLHFRR